MLTIPKLGLPTGFPPNTLPSGTAPGAALCSRRPSTGDRVIDHQYDDRSNHRDHHAVYIEAGDPARAHRCKDEAPHDRPDNAEYDVRKKPSPDLFTILLAMKPEISPSRVHPMIDMTHLFT
jgi:hypothetical protein